MNNYVNPSNFKFCPKCGNDLVQKFIPQEQTERLICQNCHFIFYVNPTPAVAIILMNNQEIVLVKRKYQPRKGAWSLPAGFMEFDETAEETAIREAKEETNLEIKIKKLFGVLPGFDDPRVRVVVIVYWGEIVNGKMEPGDDAEEAKFFPLNKLPEDIAFTAHRTILNELTRNASNGE